MRRVARFSLSIALAALAALAAACASVLGVDKTYVLAPPDAGPDGASLSPGIRCEPAACTPGSQECCLAMNDSLSCVSTAGSGDPCPGGTDVPCDRSSQCDAGVCCIQLQQPGSSILGTACESACASGELELCGQGGICAEGSCQTLTVQPAPPFQAWFYACQ